MRVLLSCVLGLLLCSGLVADDKKPDPIDAKKLVGKWEPKDLKKGESVVIEFGKDGKLTMTYAGDSKEPKREGTYKVDGDKLTVTVKRGDKEATHQMTVTKLTDTELVTKEDDKKETTFVRIKDK